MQENIEKKCKYNFSIPPLPYTMILSPLSGDEATFTKTASEIILPLEKKQYENSFTFHMFLDDLQITKTNYIIVLQSIIQKPNLFLQRKPSQIWKNNL